MVRFTDVKIFRTVNSQNQCNMTKSVYLKGKGDKRMKQWYCVTSSFDNMGRVTAAVTNIVEAEECPHNSFRSTARKDIYNEWFESEQEANDWVAQSKKA